MRIPHIADRTAIVLHDYELETLQFQSECMYNGDIARLTVLLKCCRRRLLRLLDPTSSAEESVAMRAKAANLMSRRLVAADTNENNPNETTVWVLLGLDPEAVLP
jgi:hypothetical protein